MAFSVAVQRSALRAPLANGRVQRRPVMVRASDAPKEPRAFTPDTKETVTTPQEWNEAIKKDPNTGLTETPPVAPAPGAWGFSDIMSFFGPAPELINSRLAMLGVTAALAGELNTGHSVLQQVADAPGPIFLTFVAIIWATIVPFFRGTDPKLAAWGPFTHKAELINGRWAMLGIAGLLITEFVKRAPLLQ